MLRLAPQIFLKNFQFSAFSASRGLALLFPVKFQNGISSPWINNRQFSSTVVDATEFSFDNVPTDMKATEKDAALRVAISQLSNEFERKSLDRFFGTRRAAVISTGSLKLDSALGIGGLPKGRMVEIYGQEASGKTTLALHIIKEAQKQGGYCAYLDVENALNPSVANSIGVNTDNLLISQPDSAENLLSMVDTLTKSGSISVIVVDSVAALVPQHELDTLEVGSTRNILSKIMQQALRKISYSLCHSRTLIIFLNQIRFRPKSVQGISQVEEVTCGGNFLPFYAAVRLKLIRKNLIMNGDKATGLGLSVQVMKNKLAPVMSDVMLNIQFGSGLCCESEVLELACEHGIVSDQGGCYFIGRETLNSKAEAENYLAANKYVRDQIIKSLRYVLFERKSLVEESKDEYTKT